MAASQGLEVTSCQPWIHPSQRRLVAQLDGCTSPGHSDPRVVAGSGAPPGKKPSAGDQGIWAGGGLASERAQALPRVSTVPSNQVTGSPCPRRGAGYSVCSHANLLQDCGPLHLLSSGILNLQQAEWNRVVTPLPPSPFPPPQAPPAGPVPPFFKHPSRPLCSQDAVSAQLTPVLFIPPPSRAPICPMPPSSPAIPPSQIPCERSSRPPPPGRLPEMRIYPKPSPVATPGESPPPTPLGWPTGSLCAN